MRKLSLRYILDSLVDDFKRIGPGVHVDHMHPQLSLNRLVPCPHRESGAMQF